MTAPTYLLLSAIVARPLHPRLVSLLRRRWTRQRAVVAIGRIHEGAALAFARRLLLRRRGPRGRRLVWRLDGDAGAVEGGARRPGHDALVRRRRLPQLHAPVSGGTVRKRNRFVAFQQPKPRLVLQHEHPLCKRILGGDSPSDSCRFNERKLKWRDSKANHPSRYRLDPIGGLKSHLLCTLYA